jgi:hypothetical protein
MAENEGEEAGLTINGMTSIQSLMTLVTKHKNTDVRILMFVPCIFRRSINDQQYALIVPLLYSIYWLLHVSAVACHHQGAS